VGETARNLCLILGDQLSMRLPTLRHADPSRDVVVLAELRAEATYVKHHKKKIILIFSAMRQFAQELRAAGYRVHYVRYDEAENSGSFYGEVARLAARYRPQAVHVTEPGEWRIWTDMQAWQGRLQIPVVIHEDDRFFCSRTQFAAWASGRKSLRMEYFYRDMRRQHKVLLAEDQSPIGGEWNFDAENRRRLPPEVVPRPHRSFSPSKVTREVMDLVVREFPDHFGDSEPFEFATTAAEAEQALDDFITYRLAQFGDYQDAMRLDAPVLFHAYISMYINIGLLDPKTVIARVEQAYHAGDVPLNAAEGFIRQILGWREYVRGIYWLKMPSYAEGNFFGAKRALPDFYWTGKTDMRCMAQAIGQTKQLAYAHHIQRLMVTGNFALLYGADPAAVNEWYLLVYADAFEWVELPNTQGMALFADGGLLASKPYAASGKYIDKMSDYCGECRYQVESATGEKACPFNYLYWNFLAEHQDKLEKNPRMAMMYRVWSKMPPEKQTAIRQAAQKFIANLAS
jgi:deoxyribodipyrimidine photolyase-related protein